MIPKKQTYTNDGAKSTNTTDYQKQRQTGETGKINQKPNPQTVKYQQERQYQTSTGTAPTAPKTEVKNTNDYQVQRQKGTTPTINRQDEATKKKNEQIKLNREFESVKNNYKYTDQDLINSVQYRNKSGDVISANDYKAQVDQWTNDVNNKRNNLEVITNDYKSGKYGYDDNAYNNYVNDFNRALDDYNNEYAKKDYFESYDQAEFINFQDQIDNATNEILDLNAQLDVAMQNDDPNRILDLQLRINDLNNQKDALEQSKEAQIRVQGGMAIEKYEKEGGDLNQLTKELQALDDTTLERTARQYMVNIARDTSNLMDVVSSGIDLVNQESGTVMQSAAEELRTTGQISNERYNDLIDSSQDLIDYNVKDDGLGSDLRRWAEEQETLVSVGATSNQMMAVNLSAGALTNMTEFWALGPLYRPLKAVSGGVERYAELTDRGIAPELALMNASFMSTANYYLSNIPLQYQGITFSVMARSGLTQESMKFLLSRAFNSATLSGAMTAAEYGIDWINNGVTEFLSGQETGRSYSAGDLFRNALMDMGQTFGAVMGRGVLTSGYNSLRGFQDNRDFAKYVNEFDLRMSIARKQLYVSNDNPYKDQILNRYSQYTQGPAEGYQSPIPESYLITTQQEYNQAMADRDLALQIYDNPNTTQLEKDIITQGVNAIDNGLQNYESESVIGDKIILQSEMPITYSLEEAQNGMIDTLTPNAEELLVNNNISRKGFESVEQITEAKLIENNVIAEIEEFTGQSRENRDYLLNLGERVKAISKGNVEVLVDTTLPTDKPGQTERYPDGHVVIKINPYSDMGMRYLIDHELFHAIVNTEAGKRIINFLDLYATPEQKALSRSYATNNYSEEEQNEEYYADLLGHLTEDKDLLQRLKIVDPEAYESLTGAITESTSNLYGIENQTDALLDNIIYGLEEVNNTTPGTYNAIHKQDAPYHQLSKLTELPLPKREYRVVMEEINKHPELKPGLYDVDLMDPEDYKYYKYWFTIEEYGSPIIVGKTEVDNERYSKDDRKGNSVSRGKFGISEGHIIDIKDGETTRDVFILDSSNEGRRLIGDNVSNTGTLNSKVATSDDQGRPLTEQQQEFFKNESPLFKDENGNLMTFYHSTPNQFYEFDNSKLGDNTLRDNTGYGFYFTPSIEFSQRFTNIDELTLDYNSADFDSESSPGYTMEVYLKAEKPIVHPYRADRTGNYTLEQLDQLVLDWAKATGASREFKEYMAEYEEEYNFNEPGTIYDFYITVASEDGPFGFSKGEREDLQKRGYDSIILYEGTEEDVAGIEGSDKPVMSYIVFEPNQIKNVDNTRPTDNPDIRFAKSFDPSEANSLNAKLSPYIASQSDELSDIINQAEEQIVFTGNITPAMRKSLSDIVYNATFADSETPDEGITTKDINKFLRENPLKWASLKGDNRMSLVEFQKEHPGVKFAKDGGKDWDVIMEEFDEQFPGYLNPEDHNSAVDFLDRIQEIRQEASERTNKVPTMSEAEFDEIFNKTLDEFIEAHQPKMSQPKEMSESAMKNIEKQRDMFRRSIKTWVGDYDVIRNKYNSFETKTFEDALAGIYITGSINPETREALIEDVMRNDFDGYYQGNGAKQYVDQFVNEAVDYYVLEANYSVNQRYRDTITKNANIVAQAQNNIYEEAYDRAEQAKNIDAMAKEVRLRDYDAVYDSVKTIIDRITDKKNILYGRDLKEYNDLVSNGDEELRQIFNEVFELPIRVAQGEELAILKEEMFNIIKLQKETGIKMHSKEDEAIGWIVEGKKQDGSEYYLNNLKKDFPEKWKDIKKVADYYIKVVEKWYNLEIAVRERVYGDMRYQNDVRTAKLENEVESAKSILAKREADLRNRPNSITQAGYSEAQKALATAEKKLNAQLQRNLEQDSTRRQATPYRQNYFHHTNEVHFFKNLKALAKQIAQGASRRTSRIPSELAGRTENTKPKSTIQSYMWKQGKTNYSSSGFASLQHRLIEHANAMAFDPTISYLRNVEFIFRDLDAENKASNYITWLTKYINNLAGKTNDLDRIIREMSPDNTVRVLKTLNSRAKKNAVYGNLSSALVQSGNFPVGMALAVKNGGKKTSQDLVKGMANYIRDTRTGVFAKDVSTLLQLRYFNTNLKDARLGANLDNFGKWMMECLDKTTAETLWYTFKAQGERLGVDNPIMYADEMVDRSIQSRRPEDMPLSQQSEIVKLLAPFQVEVNNQWQVMKDLVKGSVKGDNRSNNIAGMVTLMIMSALMNAGFEKIINRKPLFDPLSAVYEAISDPEATDTQVVGRVLGELFNAMPFGQYLPSILGLDSEEATKFFGESDPSRYGTGNMGISAITDLLTAETEGQRAKALENIFFTYGFPGYGKQARRVLNSAQDFGYVPKYVNGEWRRDPVHYTSSGGVGFVNDPKDVFDFMKTAIGGQYSSNAGKEYVGSNFTKLGINSLTDSNGNTISGSKALQIRKELQDAGVYDSIVEQIQSGKMKPGQAGLTDKIISMSEEEFNDAYNSMIARAEGIADQLREQYKWNEEQSKQYQEALDIEADYNNGKKVTDSEALKTRKALEDAGIYEDVLEYIENNGLDYKDVGLGKRVVGYDDDKFLEIYAKKIGGE